MAAAATSIEDQPIDNSQLWMTVFKLYDRDNSGLADEGDTIHAMMVAGRTQEQAKRMLARISEDGRVDSLGFQSALRGGKFFTLGLYLDSFPLDRAAGCMHPTVV